MPHPVLPPCLLTDFSDRIELAFSITPDAREQECIEQLIKARFCHVTNIHWYHGRIATILKPRW